MIRTLSLLAVLSLGGVSALTAQERAMSDTVRYAISWDNPASQLYTVEVTTSTGGQPVTFSLPAWRPGRYIIQNYASNVQNVRATQDGPPVDVVWTDLDSWRVTPSGPGEVTLAYEYYAHTFDAGSSTLTPEAAYFNPVNLLPWIEGGRDRPARLVVRAPADWDVVNQLAPVAGAGEPHVFEAPDYHALVDAPTIASPNLVHWRTDVDGVDYHVVLRPVGGELDLGPHSREEILADVAAIARQQAAIFGGFPYDAYWHLYQLVPYSFGHAVEHANSASYVIQDAALSTEGGYRGFLGITSHEQFHVWNVKRIRPAALLPYEYSAPQLTRLHWVTEGVTSYYDDLTLVRAGLITEDEYLAALGNNIASIQRSPGRTVTSVELASLTSWHSGYGGGNPNQSISFYTKGALLGLLLDLGIREATAGEASLDDVMRLLWTEYYQAGRGVPEDGMRAAVEAVSGRAFDEFFELYVAGTDELPYDRYLNVVGLAARQTTDPDEPEATLGVSLGRSGENVVISNVEPGSPGLAAGLMIDDVVLAVDGRELDVPTLDPVLANRAPGDTVALRIRRYGREFETTATLAGEGNVTWEVVGVENPTDEQIARRRAWLASVVESAETAPQTG